MKQEGTETSALAPSPTFKESSSAVETEFEAEDDGFEFASVDSCPDIAADEGGRDRQIYPLFDRDLLLVGVGDAVACPRSGSASSSASSVGDDLDGIQAAGSYCAWSPDKWKKSTSTGSASRRSRIRDLMVGRSRSDGKDKFVYLAKKPPPCADDEARPSNLETAKGKGKEIGGKGRKVTEMDMATAHRLYYSKAGGGGGGRRSFLPYKQDLVGFLGISRTHPF